ncbi:hypothetical protein FB45DRAFT_1008084 [Roridomyces roridus]|uniref:Uncharacterized protein n=1 Tax=Roridomyces roridus TaxID=1738132 RepID=A0AAD7BC64_9AGAR|nr:hypothetical protein FB45DRAFT_1008084 [Roridomyces roridus]
MKQACVNARPHTQRPLPSIPRTAGTSPPNDQPELLLHSTSMESLHEFLVQRPNMQLNHINSGYPHHPRALPAASSSSSPSTPSTGITQRPPSPPPDERCSHSDDEPRLSPLRRRAGPKIDPAPDTSLWIDDESDAESIPEWPPGCRSAANRSFVRLPLIRNARQRDRDRQSQMLRSKVRDLFGFHARRVAMDSGRR